MTPPLVDSFGGARRWFDVPAPMLRCASPVDVIVVNDEQASGQKQ
jgi:hypothetical protein